MLKNVIMVMFDSLQPGHLAVYGNKSNKTPNFDEFAQQGAVFDNYYLEGVPTFPRRRAMHTGLYTLPFGSWSQHNRDETTIADLCWGLPIATTYLYDAAPRLSPKFGYSGSFGNVRFIQAHTNQPPAKDPLRPLEPRRASRHNVTDDEPEYLNFIGPVVRSVSALLIYLKNRQFWENAGQQSIGQIMDSAVSYLNQRDPNRPFLLWIDSFDPHGPWDEAAAYSPKNGNAKGDKSDFLPLAGMAANLCTEDELVKIRQIYAEKITLCDTYLGILLDTIKKQGLEQDTMVMLTADHGEPLHCKSIAPACRMYPGPYEELIHAPLILRAPGIKAGQRISALVQSVDIAPTLCEWLGVESTGMQGKSLLPLVRGEVRTLREFAISGYYRSVWSVITEDWSYIHWTKDFSGMSLEAIAEAMYETALNGAEDWIRDPAAEAVIPTQNALYARHADRAQYHNVLESHPDIARKLLTTLKEFVSGLHTDAQKK